MDSCPKFVGRSELIEEHLALLSKGSVSITGPGGAGCTTFAHQFMREYCAQNDIKQTASLRMHDLSTWSELIYALGAQLDVELPGDDASVAAQIRRARKVVILLDDADLNPALSERLIRQFSPAQWITTGRQSVTEKVIPVPPLSPTDMEQAFPSAPNWVQQSGLPALGALALKVDCSRGPNWQERIAKRIRDAVQLPTGAYEEDTLSLRSLFPRYQGHITPARFLRETLDAPSTPEADQLEAWARSHLRELHLGSLGAVRAKTTAPVSLLVAIAKQVEDSSIASLAACWAARESVRRFQAAFALEILRSFTREQAPDPYSEGLFNFAKGHAHLSLGSESRAQRAFTDGYAMLTEETHIRDHLVTQCAQEWVTRGDIALAKEWIKKTASTGETLRMSASLARQEGEWVGASALLEAAEDSWHPETPPPSTIGCLDLEKAAMAIDRDALIEAQSILDRVLNNPSAHPLTKASAALRYAQITLRRGKSDATKWVERATSDYRTCGSSGGLSAAHRLRGDIAALNGYHLEAIGYWQEAASLCARISDTRALRPILERLIILEREGLPGPHIEEHQSHLDLLAALNRK